jgi:hypothetical protein
MHQSHEKITNDFGFHPATGMTAELHDATRSNFAQLAHWVIDNVPRGDAREACIHRLREAMFWANAGIACDSNPPELVTVTPTQ